MGRKATAPEHGVARYAKGECRCDVCRQAWAEYIKAYKAKKKRANVEAFFIGRTERTRVLLTPLALSMLRALSARENKQADDVVEEALRKYALAS